MEEGDVLLIASDVHELENSKNPDRERREFIRELLQSASIRVRIDENASLQAKYLESLGFHAFDALHMASATAAGAEVFLTTDDPLLRCARRNAAALRLRVLNPVEWIREADA